MTDNVLEFGKKKLPPGASTMVPGSGAFLDQFREVTEGMPPEHALKMAEAFLSMADSRIKSLGEE